MKSNIFIIFIENRENGSYFEFSELKIIPKMFNSAEKAEKFAKKKYATKKFHYMEDDYSDEVDKTCRESFSRDMSRRVIIKELNTDSTEPVLITSFSYSE